MAEKVLMPKQGNTVETCVLNQWLKKEGEEVKIGDAICEIETDKTTMMVESTVSGVVLKLLCEEGDDVPVQELIAIVGEKGEDISDLLGSEDTSKNTPEVPPAVSSAPPVSNTNQQKSSQSGVLQGAKGKAISKRAKKLAEQHAMNYEGLSGTGPRGRIIVRDIEVALSHVGKSGADNQISPVGVQDNNPIVHTLKGAKKFPHRE